MTLSEVLADAQLLSEIPPGLAPAVVRGLDYDSRRISPGFVFFAFPGARVDGRAFAAQAAEKAAIATVSELPAPEGWAAPWIQVAHGRQALALAARAFYGRLDEKLSITGITGTNGKTTTAFLLDSILRQAGKTTAMVGTIEYRMGSKTLPAPNTTPESLDLHAPVFRTWTGSAARTSRWKFPRMRWHWDAYTGCIFIRRSLPI
jgi:UDP-N-acetylmuramoyl-L-alanyl-D-glutamate--2,6-diaminopimelate ligase